MRKELGKLHLEKVGVGERKAIFKSLKGCYPEKGVDLHSVVPEEPMP